MRWGTFLRDVFWCSLGAYGGPEAHYGVFTEQMVIRKHYLTEEELLELIALTGILPGPSSTQTIVAIGYKAGGPVLAFLTMLVWALPALVMMTALSFLGAFLNAAHLSAEGLRFIGPMAVGFIAVAALRLGRKAVKDKLTLFLFLGGAAATYFLRQPWVYPLVLLLGGAASVVASKEKNLWERPRVRPPWRYLAAFAALAVGSAAAALLWKNELLSLFASFYRFGYLVIGGGQVVVPYMFTELVETRAALTSQEFLSGFGLVQGLPGPMFSFSAYAGGLAARGGGTLYQIAGALTAGIAIFLPGILLIYFVYPVWEGLKTIRGIKVSLSGITAVAGGLIAIAAFILLQKSGFTPENLLATLVTAALLLTKKIPAPLIVAAALAAGFLL